MASFLAGASGDPLLPNASLQQPGGTWATMNRCADPNCLELHRHAQVVLPDALNSAASTDSQDGAAAATTTLLAPMQRIITPLEVAAMEGGIGEIPAGEESIFVIGTQGAKVTVIRGLEPWSATLKSLVLRSNLISSLSGVETLTNLEKLELYDNCMEELPSIELEPLGGKLLILDLSFNSIRSMAAVSCCPMLHELYMAQNKLKVVEGLSGLTRLKILDLGANRIRTLDSSAECGLSGCTSLESLWLGKNKIERIGGSAVIGHLSLLKKLDIQNNRLTRIEPGEIPSARLEELYLACNGLTSLEGFWGGDSSDSSPPAHLHTVDLSRNPISSLAGIQVLAPSLEELWLTGVALQDPAQLEPLRQLKLSCIYLEHSPFAKSFGSAAAAAAGGGGGEAETRKAKSPRRRQTRRPTLAQTCHTTPMRFSAHRG